MPARVQVRAVIWIHGGIVVHRVERRGREYVTLPGGRVRERESVTDALHREVLEELGVEIVIGDLAFAGEVLSGAVRQDVELIFDAQLREPRDESRVEVVHPRAPGVEVLPPVLLHLVERHEQAQNQRRWLGNLYLRREAP